MKVKTELATRDGDIKASVDARDKVVVELKQLVGQIEGAKASAVSEYQASEAFDDNNTRYFLWGFETFQKQAIERFLGLDFPALQSYDDDDFNAEGANKVHADNHLDNASSK